jgi:hypothetical protein
MKRLSTLFLLTLLLTTLVRAQDDQPPLLIVRFGDSTVSAYQYGAVTPLDFCTAEREMLQPSTIIVSPDGFRFAFLTASARGRGNTNNLRVCDLQNRRLITLSGPPQTDIIHSIPAWSPDGTKLTYIRLMPDQDRLEFVVADPAVNNRRMVYQRSQTIGYDSLPPQVTWGALGPLAFNTNHTGQASPTNSSEYIWYPIEYIAQNKKGDAVVRQLDQFYETFEIVAGGAPGTLTDVVMRDGEAKALDLATNEVSDLPSNQIVTINPLAPQQSYINAIAMGATNEWSIQTHSIGTLLGVSALAPNTLAISPDGTQFAFITFEDYPYGGKVYILNDMKAYADSMDHRGRLQGVTLLSNFDAHYGEPGAIALFWGPSALAFR